MSILWVNRIMYLIEKLTLGKRNTSAGFMREREMASTQKVVEKNESSKTSDVVRMILFIGHR